MATNIFNITSAHNKAKLALHGDMSVSFNQAVTSQFSVQLFTSTSELFTLNTTYQFKDINGTLVTSIIFGGRPGIFIELMFDSTNQIWYIVSNNLTSNTETTKAVKVEQAIANTGGLPLYDIGDTFSYKGVPVQRIDNGISSRYTPGFIRINANIPQPNLTDPTNFGWQNLGTITIPGGTMVGKTNAVINFVMNCAAQFGTNTSYIFASIDVPGDGAIGTFFTRPVANATQASGSINLSGRDSGTISLNGNGWNAYSGSSTKRCNLMKDIVITFKYSAASGFGRAVSLNSASIDIQDSVAVPQAGVTYRDPIQQPFKSTSFWNIPLGDGATFQQATDAETACIITQNPGGVANGAYPWVSGVNGGANNFVQLKSTDPVSNFTYGSRCYHSPWPFAHNESGGSGSFRMVAPAHEFITAQSDDRVVTLITPDKRYMIESGGYSYDAATNTHRLGYCTVWDLYGTGLTNNIDPTLPLASDGYRASGHPLCGGIIRVSDLQAGKINHVIAMQLSQWQQKAGVFSVVGTPAGGTTFSVKPLDAQQKSQSYAALLKAGTVVGFANADYTLAADSTYDSATNTTNFTVTTSIVGTNGYLYLNGANRNSQKNALLVWPATNIDGYSLDYGQWGCYRGVVPMGAMFGIPPTVDVTKLGLTAEGLALALAFQQYGGVNNDTTNNTFSLCFLENGMTQTQKDNLNRDRITIKNQLRMITNISAANPGGPGNRVVARPPEIRPLY